MTQLLAFLVLYAFAGSIVKWLLDYRIKDSVGDHVGRELRRHMFPVYFMALVIWPLTAVILLSVYGGKLFAWVIEQVVSGMGTDSITGAYEKLYQKVFG